MNTPVTTTVISVEVPLAGGAARAEVASAFERTVTAVAMQMGFITKEQGGPQLSVTLEPNAAVGPQLQRLANAFADFEAQCAPLKVRGVAHYGTVFRSEAGGKLSYLGSAIRSSQSALKRTDVASGLLATREFAAYISGFNPPLVPLKPLPTPSADGFTIIQLDGKGSSGARNTGLSVADPDFIVFLKKRLAEDLGPFATAMVENSRRNAATAQILVAELAREVDNVDTRRKFEADMTAYIKKRTAP